MRTFLQIWLQKNPVQELRIVHTNLEESPYPREQCARQRQTWRYIYQKHNIHASKIKVFFTKRQYVMFPLTFFHRGLPPQTQKTLDTDLSAQEFQESVRIYQVIMNTILTNYFIIHKDQYFESNV